MSQLRPESPRSSELPHRCPECSYRSEWAFDVVHHVRRAHKNVYAAELFHAIVEPEQYPCIRCNFKSRCRLGLHEHCRLEHREYDGDFGDGCELFGWYQCWYECNRCKFRAHAGLQVVKHLDCFHLQTTQLRKLLVKSKVDAPLLGRLDARRFDIESVVAYLRSLPQPQLPKSTNGENEEDEGVLRARAHAAYHRGSFQELRAILKSHAFQPQLHKELQKLWFESHYREAQMKQAKPLSAVAKYRIRDKHPPPRTIWDGQKTYYLYNERTRDALKEFYRTNAYPTPQQKLDLAAKSGLSQHQVSNWFKNQRQRQRSRERSRCQEAQLIAASALATDRIRHGLPTDLSLHSVFRID